MSSYPVPTKPNPVIFTEKVMKFPFIKKLGACQKGDDCPYSHDFPVEKLDV